MYNLIFHPFESFTIIVDGMSFVVGQKIVYTFNKSMQSERVVEWVMLTDPDKYNSAALDVFNRLKLALTVYNDNVKYGGLEIKDYLHRMLDS